ncbi:MAG: Asp-tRNA(Asn)/Glu-tRNA(Gln) amidotransferase subunit GatB [Candidatus Krumholzibacteria bacterium]|nr:Asp-tRNA(Asn)/Glu-tRNA(Gln) amidotransferase subunit GatB [Candidatus Krumholzibacteria bacterium]
MAAVEFETVIGLEVHAQLVTKSKVFCSCPAVYGGEPNAQTCPVCLGLPGALPVLNEEAVSMAILMGLATGCRIAPRSVFARKNYFYPDCPKNYQISMYDKPLCEEGRLEFELDGEIHGVALERIHLEEDAGKLIHAEEGGSLVDFNRCGVPLIEIVSKPEIRSPEEASRYLVSLRQVLRYLGICDGNMEEGSLRCDVNISLRRPGEPLGTKTEIKNLNSFKAVEMGIRFEIERQAGVLRSGGRIEQVTNLWDSGQKKLLTMRSKEYAHDYRYFPEPDLLPLDVDGAWIEKMRGALPELPLAREKRFREKYNLPAYDAGVLCAERGLADYYETVVSAGSDPKLAAHWVMREILEEIKSGAESEGASAPAMRAVESSVSDAFAFRAPVAAGRLAELIALVSGGVISNSAGREIFKEMVRTAESPDTIREKLNLTQVSGAKELEQWVADVIAESPDEVARYRGGKTQLLGFFVGQVMKKSAGKANPKLAGEIVKKMLEG